MVTHVTANPGGLSIACVEGDKETIIAAIIHYDKLVNMMEKFIDRVNKLEHGKITCESPICQEWLSVNQFTPGGDMQHRTSAGPRNLLTASIIITLMVKRVYIWPDAVVGISHRKTSYPSIWGQMAGINRKD